MAWLNDGVVQAYLLGAGAVLVWALALYVASRAPTRRAPMLAALAMLCLAAYLSGEALGALAPDLAGWSGWLRRTWLAPSVALPVWLVLTLALAADEGPEPLASRVRRLLLPVALAAVAIGALFGLIGAFTTLVQDWNAPFNLPVTEGGQGAHHNPRGPLLPAFQMFALVCLVWAALNLVLLWRGSPPGSPLRARFAWLSASAALFVLGGAWIVIGSGVYLVAGLPGQMLLITGMVILGWNMVRYGALLAGEQVLSDFLAFAATILAIIGVYGAILLTLPSDYSWFERGLPLLLVIMTTHVVVDTRGHLLDRLLYAPLLSTLRGQLRELSNRVVRQPDELSALADVRETVDQILRDRAAEASAAPPVEANAGGGTELRVLVEGALRHLNDLPSLSLHPLLTELPAVAKTSGTPLERAARLRSELDQAIERLRPAGARPPLGSGALGGWLHYLVLKEAYAEGRPNKQIMQRYWLSEGTFHRARRRAIDAVASDLVERARTTRAWVSSSG